MEWDLRVCKKSSRKEGWDMCYCSDRLHRVIIQKQTRRAWISPGTQDRFRGQRHNNLAELRLFSQQSWRWADFLFLDLQIRVSPLVFLCQSIIEEKQTLCLQWTFNNIFYLSSRPSCKLLLWKTFKTNTTTKLHQVQFHVDPKLKCGKIKNKKNKKMTSSISLLFSSQF